MEELLDKATDEFKKIKDTIRIISHLDADGISSSSIFIKCLLRENKKFSLSVVKQLDEKILKELSREKYKNIFFVDLGSGSLCNIKKYLSDRNVFILDHHILEECENNFFIVNPHLLNIENASSVISGAGVTYLFCKKLNEKNMDMAHIAVVGALGDIQSFESYNKRILEDAIKMNKIEIRKGLRMFGTQTRPLHKLLQYSTDPYIPNVTGSEEGAINFLEEIGVKFRDQEGYRKLIDLDKEEMKKLVTGIILKRLGSEEDAEDVLGDIYILTEEEEESYTKDAREFSTLLNACGRLGKHSIGIGTCLGNKECKEEANMILKDYKTEIIKSLDWFYNNRNNFIEKDGFVIINSESNVKDTLIGTLCSIVSNSNLYADGTIIVGMTYTLDNKIKISLRVSGKRNLDLKDILRKIIANGEVGGHKKACGALIDIGEEESFINNAIKILSEYGTR
ncbi:MAG: DHH family phosphoesterase [archaeon]